MCLVKNELNHSFSEAATLPIGSTCVTLSESVLSEKSSETVGKGPSY